MVANAGVAAAKSIKDKGAEVYTIGIQSGADAGEVTEETSDSNRFLHAVSSNYPNATANDRGSLGERTGTKDYYKAATSAAGVKEAMLSVLESIGSEASPVTLALTGQKDLYEEKENELAPKELTGGEFLVPAGRGCAGDHSPFRGKCGDSRSVHADARGRRY